MEIITLVTIIIGFLGLFIMNLQLNNQVRNETRSQFLELKSDIKEVKADIRELREDNKAIHTRIDILSTRIDKIHSELSSRIDRLADAVYSQKAS